jgi:hypothetical protein
MGQTLHPKQSSVRECVDAENFRFLWLLSACSALDEQTRDGGAHKDGAARYKNRI